MLQQDSGVQHGFLQDSQSLSRKSTKAVKASSMPLPHVNKFQLTRPGHWQNRDSGTAIRFLSVRFPSHFNHFTTEPTSPVPMFFLLSSPSKNVKKLVQGHGPAWHKRAVNPSKAKQNRGLWECAFCTPLYIFSVLTYALIGKEKTNDKTQLSASFPWACKTKKNTKKTRKPRRPTGPECLWHRVVFFCFLFCFFVFFVFFCFFCFLGVLVFFGFGNLWPTGSSFGS